MEPLIGELNRMGYAALLVTLAGHGCDHAQKYACSAEAWIENLRDAWQAARQRFPDKKLYNLSFSLGALATTALLDADPKISFEKMIYLAPAIKPHVPLMLARPLLWLGGYRIGTPSIMPRDYRAWSWTPLRFYTELMRLVESAAHLQRCEKLNSIPTLILMSPADRLVSWRALKKWLDRHNLSNWSIQTINPQPEIDLTLAHLITDPKAVGAQEWARMVRLIESHVEQAK